MLHQIVRWLREEARGGPSPGNWSRWIGRSWARVSYAYRVEPTWLESNRFDVLVAGLGAHFEGFTIAQLSDFHCSRHVTPAYLKEAIQIAEAANPDLIALTGDFIHRGYRHIQAMAATLARLHAPHGVLAVLGNHDFSVRNALGYRRHCGLHAAVAGALEARGIRVLRNESICLERAGEKLQIAGVEDLWSRECDVEAACGGLDQESPTIVLAHNPCTVEMLAGKRCDLMLSGHTHGGQIHHPVFGRPTLGRKGRRYAAGMYRVGKTQLYVNKGVGFGFRLRYGARPEVALLTLRASAA